MSQMDHFEDELRNAMRREEPPEGFAGRVLARAASEPAKPEASWFRMPALRLALAGAFCLVAVVGVRLDDQRRQRLHGEAAKQQVMLALRVTGSKLMAVNDRVRELTSPDSPRR